MIWWCTGRDAADGAASRGFSDVVGWRGCGRGARGKELAEEVEDAGKRRKRGRTAYLYSGLEGQESIAGITHFEDAAKPILGQVADFENLEVRRDGAQVELANEDVIDDDGRLGRLVEGLRQEVARATVEVGVSRERRPVEVEGHVEMAVTVLRP